MDLEKLVVKMVGDAREYQKMLDDAMRGTQHAVSVLAEMGRVMVSSVVTPLIQIGKKAVETFGAFDKAMIESLSILSATEDQMRRMRDEALNLSTKGKQSAEDLARAYFFLASAGLDAEQSITALAKVQAFATAGAFSLERATTLLLDAQSALGLKVKDPLQNAKNMERVSDVLVRANQLANANVQQFSDALTNTAAASMRVFNREVEEGVAVLAAMADQGIKGRKAGMNYSRILLLLANASRDGAKEFKKLGFEVFDSQGGMRKTADVIQNLNDVTKGMSDEARAAALEALGFEARIQHAILPILNSADAMRTFESELKKGGSTATTSAFQMTAFDNQMTAVKNTIDRVYKEIGELLAPTLLVLAAIVQRAAIWWSALGKEIQALIVTVASFVAILGTLLLIYLTIKVGLAAFAAALAFSGSAMTLASIGMWGLTAAVGAFAALVALKTIDAIQSFTGVKDALAKVGLEIQRNIKLQDEWGKMFGKRTASKIEDIKLIRDPGDRKSAIKAELDEARGLVSTYGAQVTRTQKELEKAQSFKGVSLTDALIHVAGGAVQKLFGQYDQQFAMEMSHAADAVKRLTEAKKRLESIQDLANEAQKEEDKQKEPEKNLKIIEGLDALNDRLTLEIATFGMSADAAAAHAIKLDGANEGMLRFSRTLIKQKENLEAAKKATDDAAEAMKKLREQATQVEKEIATPEEEFTTKVKELQKLLQNKLLSNEEFLLAVSLAKGKFAESEQKNEGKPLRRFIEMFKDITKEGEAVTKQFAKPIDKLAAEFYRLQDLQKSGAITQEVFNDAMKNARKDFTDTTEAIRKAREELEKFDAVGRRTPEAGKRISDYLEKLRAGFTAIDLPVRKAATVLPQAKDFNPPVPPMPHFDPIPPMGPPKHLKDEVLPPRATWLESIGIAAEAARPHNFIRRLRPTVRAMQDLAGRQGERQLLDAMPRWFRQGDLQAPPPPPPQLTNLDFLNEMRSLLHGGNPQPPFRKPLTNQDFWNDFDKIFNRNPGADPEEILRRILFSQREPSSGAGGGIEVVVALLQDIRNTNREMADDKQAKVELDILNLRA